MRSILNFIFLSFFIVGCGDDKTPGLEVVGYMQIKSKLDLNSERGNALGLQSGVAKVEIYRSKAVVDTGLARFPFEFREGHYASGKALMLVTNLSNTSVRIGRGFDSRQPVDLYGSKTEDLVSDEEQQVTVRCVVSSHPFFSHFIHVGKVMVPQYRIDTQYGDKVIVQRVRVYRDRYNFTLTPIDQTNTLAQFDAEMPLREVRKTVRELTDCH